ncbi:MAG: hypothetical protein AB1568_00320 [Thermodesulfobacteriota bacterium]
MDAPTARQLLQIMLVYFETGNQETDGAAKNIFETAVDYRGRWQEEVARFRQSSDWSGLRAPEAELLAAALRHVLAGEKAIAE